MQKNVANQKLIVFAFDATTNQPATGDAANLTAYVSKDYGSVTVLTDTSATEMDATNAKGYYLFDLAQAETNADTLLFSAKSSTSNIVAIAVPATVFTVPPSFNSLTIANNATAANVTRLLGTAWLTPGTAGTPDVNVKLWNGLATVALPLTPATAGRTLVIDAAGLADANVVKVGPSGSGTAQTARDIGASVLLSSGTGTGQLDFTSGVVKANVTQFGGSAGTFSSGRPEVNTTHLGGDNGGIAGLSAAGLDYGNDGFITANTTHVGGTVQTAGNIPAELAKVPKSDGTASWNATAAAQIQSEANDALVANNLDHLVLSAVDTDFATTVHLNSVIGHLADNGTSATFDRTTDSLEAARDNVGTAGAGLTAADDATISAIGALNNITAASVWAVGTRTLTAGTNIDGSTFTAIPWNAAWDAEVQSEVADALAVYDPPTNAEMEARTLVAASYATAASIASLNNLSAAQVTAAVPTAAQNATAWGASIVGNSRTRDMYLQGLVNKIAFAADGLTYTLYASDDTTELATGTATRLATSVGGLRSVDPA